MTTEPVTLHDRESSPNPISSIQSTLAVHPTLDLDPGIEVVDRAHRVLGIDAPWSLRHGRGFSHRTGGLVQRAWSEPGSSPDRPDRAVAEIELVRGVRDLGLAMELANALNAMATMSALVVDPVRATIALRSGVGVSTVTVPATTTPLAHTPAATPATIERAGRWFAVAAGLQAATAPAIAELLANATGGTIAAPRHPGAAVNPGTERTVHMDRLVAIAGREPSRWSGSALTAARDHLALGALRRLTAADATTFTMPLPVAGDMALLQALTHEPHPLLGNGLKLRLTLPHGLTEAAGATIAAELNRLEAASATADGIGAWVGTGGQLQHVAFLPNAAHTGDDDATELLRSGMARARWASDVLA